MERKSGIGQALLDEDPGRCLMLLSWVHSCTEEQRSQRSTPWPKTSSFRSNMPAMEMRGFQLRAVPRADPSPSAE